MSGPLEGQGHVHKANTPKESVRLVQQTDPAKMFALFALFAFEVGSRLAAGSLRPRYFAPPASLRRLSTAYGLAKRKSQGQGKTDNWARLPWEE